MYKTRNFTEKVLANSQNNDWVEAKKEWELKYPYLTDEGTCICGQKHIKEMVNIYNPITNVYLNIGHCCYKSLLGRASLDGIFKILRYEQSLMIQGIRYMPSYYQILRNYDCWIINEWECNFLISIRTYCKREYSEKQLKIFKEILPRIKWYSDKYDIYSLIIAYDSGAPTITGLGRNGNYVGGRPFFNTKDVERLPRDLYKYRYYLKNGKTLKKCLLK